MPSLPNSALPEVPGPKCYPQGRKPEHTRYAVLVGTYDAAGGQEAR